MLCEIEDNNSIQKSFFSNNVNSLEEKILELKTLIVTYTESLRDFSKTQTPEQVTPAHIKKPYI